MLEQATILRKQGLTYKAIAEQLEVSVDWCKRNLKGIKKESIADACIKELVDKSTTPAGITIYEANAIIFKHNKGNKLTSDQLKNIRKKAVYANDKCMFRPAWVDATNPIESYKSMMAYTLHLMEEIDNIVRHYCDSYPSVNPAAVKYELIKHAYPKMTPESLTGRVMRSEVVVEKLAERNISTVNVGNEIVGSLADQTVKTKTDLDISESDIYNLIELSEEELDTIWLDKHFTPY